MGMRHLVLVNPNTNVGTTGLMVEIAKQAAPPGVAIRSATASFGVALITNEEQLSTSAVAVERLVASMDLVDCGGVIVAAFGDPGLEALRREIALPVTGIAEAAFQEAASYGRRFSVVTTTPDLVPAIERCAEAYGHGRLFAGVQVTDGDILKLSNDPPELERRLARACEFTISQDAAEVIIIGGGPLAVHARALARRFSVPIVEPIPAAVRLAAERAADFVLEA
jgi:Asp/Glu/hydantoin racemase